MTLLAAAVALLAAAVALLAAAVALLVCGQNKPPIAGTSGD